MTISSDDSTAQRFDDPRNITIGTGRIIWANQARPVIPEDDIFIHVAAMPEAWVLPGGRRTNDPVEANMAAIMINQLSR